MKSTYLLIDLCSLSVPLVFSFHPKLNFYRQFRFLFPALFISSVIFILWDILFTKIGIWGFSETYTLGINFAGLPIEEYLFFLCIPYACLFTYHCLLLFFHPQWKPKTEKIVGTILSSLLILTGIFFYNKWYTSVTFLSSGLFILLILFVFKVKWFGKLLSIYPALLIPFFIVNGLLTGTGLQEPVVWYNSNEIIGFRLLSIPFEDVFYGMLLLLLNILIYERLKEKSQQNN